MRNITWSVIAALLGTVTASHEARAQTASPDTGPMPVVESQQVPQSPSLEGMSIGMTMAEAARISGIDIGGAHKITERFLRMADDYELSAGYLGNQFHTITTSDRRGWIVEDPNGVIVWLRMVYTTSGAMSLKADPEPNAMIRLLTDRWGAPASTTLSQDELRNGFNATVASEHLVTVTWQVASIRAVYTVGRALIDPGKHPVITGLMQSSGGRPETFRADVTIFDSVAREAADAAHDDATLKDAKDKVKF